MYTVSLSRSAAVAYLWFNIVTLFHIYHEILIILWKLIDFSL